MILVGVATTVDLMSRKDIGAAPPQHCYRKRRKILISIKSGFRSAPYILEDFLLFSLCRLSTLVNLFDADPRHRSSVRICHERQTPKTDPD
jgi:hypothetical protein